MTFALLQLGRLRSLQSYAPFSELQLVILRARALSLLSEDSRAGLFGQLRDYTPAKSVLALIMDSVPSENETINFELQTQTEARVRHGSYFLIDQGVLQVNYMSFHQEEGLPDWPHYSPQPIQATTLEDVLHDIVRITDSNLILDIHSSSTALASVALRLGCSIVQTYSSKEDRDAAVREFVGRVGNPTLA